MDAGKMRLLAIAMRPSMLLSEGVISRHRKLQSKTAYWQKKAMP